MVGAGGIINYSVATINNSTISDNSGDKGGGIVNVNIVIINSSTLLDNSANSSGGGIFNVGTATFNNSIIANSSSGGDCANVAPTFNNSLVEDGSCSISGMGNLTGDPMLGPLADNGGTTLTHALLAGSPAIGNGNPVTCLPTDQRGFLRDAACDIGAYELDGVPTAIVLLRAVPTNYIPLGLILMLLVTLVATSVILCPSYRS